MMPVFKGIDRLVRDSKVGKFFDMGGVVEKIKRCGKIEKPPVGGFSHYTLISSVT
jgi:hypothetical protein